MGNMQSSPKPQDDSNNQEFPDPPAAEVVTLLEASKGREETIPQYGERLLQTLSSANWGEQQAVSLVLGLLAHQFTEARHLAFSRGETIRDKRQLLLELRGLPAERKRPHPNPDELAPPAKRTRKFCWQCRSVGHTKNFCRFR